MPEEARFILGLAYQAGPDPRITKGMDGGRDYFTPEELEKASRTYIPGGAQVGLFHVDGTEKRGHVTVTESYIYRGPPWDQGDGVVIKAGDWLIGGICDEFAWDLVKSGKVKGFPRRVRHGGVACGGTGVTGDGPAGRPGRRGRVFGAPRR